jgi:GntR family transcriptional regulator/MocR family aminotransferase
MRRWELALDLRANDEQPIFLRLARAITDDVRRGRLRPGDPLPGSRTLARTLGVHRNTVLAAYAELTAEGWITTQAAAGTFVSPALPEVEPRRTAGTTTRTALPTRLGFELPRPRSPHGLDDTAARILNTGSNDSNRRSNLISLAGGVPDVRLLPTASLARAYRRALQRHGARLLGYGDARGHERLRAALASMLSALRGLAATADDVLLTRGSQQALDLVARAMLAPGDVVAVEGLGYRPAWSALSSTGAHLLPLPVDRDGVDVEALAALAQRQPLRAVYVTPHHQYPTTAVLAAGRRLRLLELARAHRFAIVEDDYDFEFHYEGRPVLPLAASDRDGVVVYVGTLSKILAPTLRLGFLVAPAPLLARATELRLAVDRHGDAVVECAVSELIEDGELQRHTRRMRRVYQSRRDFLAEALGRRLGSALSFTVPAGGMALWAHADGLDVEAWVTRARARGVELYTARRYAFDGRPRPALRLGFASSTEAELAEGVRRLAASVP